MAVFPIPIYLSAYPHYYDFIQSIALHDDGKLEMVAGAGQVITTIIKGSYQVQETEESHITNIYFSQLAEYAPYSNNKIADLPALNIQITSESGDFAFYQEVVWKIDNPEEYPCLLFNTRYILDKNPFIASTVEEKNNLYHIMENKDFVDSSHIYYASHDRRELPLNKLKQLGIDINQ